MHRLLRAGRLGEARRALEAAERAREGFAYPYGAMVTARLAAALSALEQGWPRPPGVARRPRAHRGGGRARRARPTLRAAAVLARRHGDRVSEARLLAAVPPAPRLGERRSLRRRARRRATVRRAGARRAAARARAPRRAGGRAPAGERERSEGSGEGRPPATAGAGDAGACASRAGARRCAPEGPRGPRRAPRAAGEELHCLQLMGGRRVRETRDPSRCRGAPQLPGAHPRAPARRRRGAGAPRPGPRGARRGRARRAGSSVAEGFGLGGRERRAGATAERARSAVTGRARAVKRIGEVHPDLGRHLANSVRTGTGARTGPNAPPPGWYSRTSSRPQLVDPNKPRRLEHPLRPKPARRPARGPCPRAAPCRARPRAAPASGWGDSG